MALALLHGATYHCVWAAQREWAAQALSQGAKFNFLAGGLALACGGVLWAAALAPLRGAPRFGYPLFKAAHHAGFWGFLVFGAAHNHTIVWCCLPGLVLWLAEAALRALQAAAPCHVLHAAAAPGGAVVTLVAAAPARGAAAAGTAWLNLPGLSALQWHPFDYVAVPWQGAGGCAPEGVSGAEEAAALALLIQVGARAGWTRRLAARVASAGATGAAGLRLQGPYAGAAPAGGGGGVDAVALIAGALLQGPSPQQPWSACWEDGGIIAAA
jgi:hypothetical protein